VLLNTIVKDIKRESHRGNQVITTDQITADIVAAVNKAMRDIEKLLPKRFWRKTGTLTTVIGTQGVPAILSLPTDLNEISDIWYTVGTVYFTFYKVESDREWIRQVWNPNASVNRPYYYREIGPDNSGNRQIEIFPIPYEILTLTLEYYRLKSADLTVANLSSELPDIPDKYQDVIQKGALYYFLKGYDDPLGQIAKGDYEQAKLALENGDDADMDSELRLRFGMLQYRLPGFRMD
jgi:hypothetical protein